MTGARAATTPLIEFERVRKASGAGRPVLDQASFAVGRGGWVVLTGADGAGKSTVLTLITGWPRWQPRLRPGPRNCRPRHPLAVAARREAGSAGARPKSVSAHFQ